MKRWDNLGTVIELTVTVADAVGVPGVRMGHDLCRLAYRLVNGDPQAQRIAKLESQQCASLGARTLYAANQNAWDWPQGPDLGAAWQPDARLLQAPSAREILIPEGQILASALSILPVGFHQGILSSVIFLDYLMEEEDCRIHDEADPMRVSVLFKNAGGRYCVGFTDQRTLQRLGVTLLPQWQDNGRHLPVAQRINATACQQWGLAPLVEKTKALSSTLAKQAEVSEKPTSRPALPAIQDISGKSAQWVQTLQRDTAAALGREAVFSGPAPKGEPGPALVVIPAGRFQMGSLKKEEPECGDDERQHSVTMEQPFALGRYAVTVGDFRRFVKASVYQTEAERDGGSDVWTGKKWEKDPDRNWQQPGLAQDDDHPVVCISWHDALAYCRWLGKGYGLPTEAEWEYACRAGTGTAFHWGNTIDPSQANYNGTVDYAGGKKGEWRKTTVPVKTFVPNAWGLYQMHGNMREWTASVYERYQGGETRIAEDQDDGLRVLRGGFWYDNPRRLRSAYRCGYYAMGRNQGNGLRVVFRPRT